MDLKGVVENSGASMLTDLWRLSSKSTVLHTVDVVINWATLKTSTWEKESPRLPRSLYIHESLLSLNFSSFKPWEKSFFFVHDSQSIALLTKIDTLKSVRPKYVTLWEETAF